MSNTIKYSTGSESLALKKGNFWIGTGDVGKGPSETTGYYNGVTPGASGYVIYLNKEGAPGDLSYGSLANDEDLISYTNSLAGTSYTTAQQCFDYYYGQNDKVLVNQVFPPTFPYIVMDGLVFYVDAGISQSYPGSGSSWEDVNGLGPRNNGTLVNGPTFSSLNGGSIVFDGVDDRIGYSNNILTNLANNGITFDAWIYPTSNLSSQQLVVGAWSQSSTNDQGGLFIINSGPFIAIADGSTAESGQGFGTLSLNQWQYIVGTWNTNRTYKTYINGNLQGSGLQTGNGYNTVGSSLFNIGAQNQSIGRFFYGRIANVKIYNRVLSDSEVLQNYNAQKGRFGL